MSMELTDSRLRPVRRETPGSNPEAHARSWPRAMLNGALLRCPSCGEGHLYDGGRLKVVNYCPHCEEELYHHRASRMAPWFSAFLAAHIVVLAAWIISWFAPLSLGWAALPALAVWAGLTWLLLPSVKGAVVGIQWATRMLGFQYAAMCKPRHPHPHKH